MSKHVPFDSKSKQVKYSLLKAAVWGFESQHLGGVDRQIFAFDASQVYKVVSGPTRPV